MLSNHRHVRPLRFIVLLVVLCGLYWVSGFPETYDDEELPPSQRHNAPATVAGDQLVVSVKTTTSDAWTELPPLLVLTDPEYHGSLLLMGDFPLNLGAFRVEDLLDRYTEQFVTETPELERYRRTMEYGANSVDFVDLKEKDPRKEKEVLATLDKYKILRWVERTWLLRPSRRWYVFTEADVHLVRSNLLSWLGGYDPAKHHFFTNAPVSEHVHTFVLSEAAMKAIMVDHADLIPSYDDNIHAHKNAFEVLTTVLKTTLNLDPTSIWPSMSAYTPATVPYGPGLWCEQVHAMSKMSPDLMSEMSRFERERRDQQTSDPLSFADLWFRFMQPEKLDTPRDDWDNLSSGSGYGQWNILFDPKPNAHQHPPTDLQSTNKAKPGEDSWEACRDSCANIGFCVQWSYSSIPTPNDNENGDTKCHLSRGMKFGSHVQPQEREQAGEKVELKWKSGWQKERFRGWAKQQRCKDQQN